MDAKAAAEVFSIAVAKAPLVQCITNFVSTLCDQTWVTKRLYSSTAATQAMGVRL
jgi:hypothetical protein